MKYEAIVFDLFGTLVYRRLKVDFLRHLVASIDRHAAARLIMGGNYPDARSMADALSLECTAKQIETAQAAIDSDCENVVLMHDAKRALSHAKALGCRIYCLSNLATPWARAVSGLGILEEFDKVFLSCETGLLKPNAESFAQIPEDPSKTLMVGDKLWDDARPALSVGMGAALRGQDIVATMNTMMEPGIEWLGHEEKGISGLRGMVGGEERFVWAAGTLVDVRSSYDIADWSEAMRAAESSMAGDDTIIKSYSNV